jgi:hypothetical protein
MSVAAPAEWLVTYPGSEGDEVRGQAHLMIFGSSTAVVGDLEDNPGEDVVNAIEVIAIGLRAAELVDRDFTLFHYRPHDHVKRGPALWKIAWGRHDSGHPRFTMPTWEDPSEGDKDTVSAVLALVESIQPYESEVVEERGADCLDLLVDDDFLRPLAAALKDRSSDHLWQEVAELGFGDGTVYKKGTGRLVGLRQASREASDQWLIRVELALGVVRPEGDDAEISDYPVTFRVFGSDYPPSLDDLWVMGG